MQDFPIRFETTFAVVQRFFNSIPLLDEVIKKNMVYYGSSVQAKEQFAQVHMEVLNEKIVYPGLKVVIDVIPPLQHAQALLKEPIRSP